jgi:hypothetical protein
LKDGVLRVSLPKAEAVKPRKITVSSTGCTDPRDRAQISKPPDIPKYVRRFFVFARVADGNEVAIPSQPCFSDDMLAAFNLAFLFLPLGFGLALLIVWGARNQARKTRAELTAFALQAGLRMEERTILGVALVESLAGESQGRPLRYWTYSTGSGKSRTTWVAVGVGVPAGIALEFELTRQNFGTKVMELFGAREIQVGDPVFDAAWFVQTNQPEFFTAALVPAIRARLMAEAESHPGAGYKLEPGMVRYAERGALSAATLERLAAKLPLLQELADVAEVSAGPNS